MSIRHVQVISVPVSDQEQAKQFYVQRLGLECRTDTTWGEGMRWIEVAPPGSDTTLSLVTWFPNMLPGGLGGMVLASDDIEQDYADLSARGVQFQGPITHDPNGRFALFHDLDGNGWMLHQA